MNLRPKGENKLPGQLYYESLCFKAVNQSIGRAIRHQRDYATLILADARYGRPTSVSSLPGWIAQRLTVNEKFGPTLASIRKVPKWFINFFSCDSRSFYLTVSSRKKSGSNVWNARESLIFS